jgi:hypothetical protein
MIGNLAVNNANTNLMIPPFGGCTAVDNNTGTP